ncbi:hypothetical protein V1504DRAFT_463222 [Lipomyces starkeyi]
MALVCLVSCISCGDSIVLIGTMVQTAGVDGAGVATLRTAPVGGFGPQVGSWQ